MHGHPILYGWWTRRKQISSDQSGWWVKCQWVFHMYGCEERLNVHISDFLWSAAIPCSTYVYTTVQSRNQIKLSLRPLFEGPPLTLTTFIFIYLLFIFLHSSSMAYIKPAAFVNAIHSLSKITLYRIARFLNSYAPQKAQKRYRVWYVKIKLKGASLSDRDVKKRLVYKNSDTKTFFKWTSSKQAPRLWRALPPPSCGSIPVHQRSPSPPLSVINE